jgi:hypothetical protein
MRNEVRLEDIRQEHEARIRAFEHYEKTQKHHRRQQYNGIKTNISPNTYDGKLDWLRARVCRGTENWLTSDTTFLKWLDTTEISAKILWLQGIPGAGALQHIILSFSSLQPNDQVEQGKLFWRALL